MWWCGYRKTAPPDPCVVSAFNLGDVGIVDENGCSVGAHTQPNVGGTKGKDPCDLLKELSEKQYFKDNMDVLNSNVPAGTKEKGFILLADDTTPVSPIITDGLTTDSETIDYGQFFNTAPASLLNAMYGNSHNHLASNLKHVGIFPPDDLATLALFGIMETLPQSPIYSVTPKKAVTYVITDKGFFALKINDLVKLKAYVLKYSQMLKNGTADEYNAETFQDKDEYNIRNESTHNELVKGFLRFIRDEDIGIDLYEGNKDTYKNWNKLELIDNGNGNYDFNEIPCTL